MVPIGSLHVFGLEKTWRGKDDVGVVGRIGKELLVDHRKQVAAPHTAKNFVLIGSNGGGIGVVDEESLYRRSAYTAFGSVRASPRRFMLIVRAGRPRELACISSGICSVAD